MATVSRTVDQLLESLGPLNSKETKALLAQLALKVKTPQTNRGDRDAETWADAVSDALTNATGTTAASAIVRKEMLLPTTWGPVKLFMEEAGFMRLTVAEKQSVFRLLARLLVQDADRIAADKGRPLSPSFVANCAGRIGAVFENAFPDYLASGLAHIVVRRLCHGQTRLAA